MKQLSHAIAAQVVGGRAAVGANAAGGNAKEIGAAITAVGAAYGANAAITAAGGLGNMGAAASAASGAIGAGVAGAGYIGYTIGGWLYESSETVQGTAQNMVERVITAGPIGAVAQGVSDIWHGITSSGRGDSAGGGGSSSGSVIGGADDEDVTHVLR